jgi:hypothetical protein
VKPRPSRHEHEHPWNAPLSAGIAGEIAGGIALMSSSNILPIPQSCTNMYLVYGNLFVRVELGVRSPDKPFEH